MIITNGDNSYPAAWPWIIDLNIGKYYSSYVGNYQGKYGKGAGNGDKQNRFFPSAGNHDHAQYSNLVRLFGLEPITLQPYLDYFTLPGKGFANTSGNERYYDFVYNFKGVSVHFFALNSDQYGLESDGVDKNSKHPKKEMV